MLLARHVTRLLTDSLRYAVATRRVAILLTVVIGLALATLALLAQATAPFVLYPFV